MKAFLTVLALSSSFAAVAQEGDLVLPGEKWIAKFNKYICAAFGPEVARPSSLESMNVAFETLTTDATLDNGLIKATFTEEGSACRYSAILFADNAAATIHLVQSKAYATEGTSACAAGQAMLDAYFEANDYLYYGHPHNLAIMAPVEGARQQCGSDLVGVNFVVAGRVQQ